MKNEELNFDDILGNEKTKEFTKSQHDQIRAQRKANFEQRAKDKFKNDALEGFRFSIRRRAEDDNVDDPVSFGFYLDQLLHELNIKRSVFASYIEISPRNINKYLSGERKFNIQHALMLEKIFNINAKNILQMQLKNEIFYAKKKSNLHNLNLNDLLAG